MDSARHETASRTPAPDIPAAPVVAGDHVALTDARIEGDCEVVLEISASRD